MSPKGEPEQPLFPSDIIEETSNSPAIQDDIIRGSHELGRGSYEAQSRYINLRGGHLLARELGFGILRRLEEMGVPEAAILTESLEEIDPQLHIFESDLFSVASRYAEESQHAPDADQRDQAQQLERIARVVAAIAAAKIETEPVKRLEVMRYAEDMLGSDPEINASFSEETLEALSACIEEAKFGPYN
jgi:hypothetical protein